MVQLAKVLSADLFVAGAESSPALSVVKVSWQAGKVQGSPLLIYSCDHFVGYSHHTNRLINLRYSEPARSASLPMTLESLES